MNMKKYLLPALRLTLVMLVLCCVIYFGIVTLIGKATPNNGGGQTVQVSG
ncbi:MAG: potassium-transporting ATPase subunit C, partial [Flavitalea sp.]